MHGRKSRHLAAVKQHIVKPDAGRLNDVFDE